MVPRVLGGMGVVPRVLGKQGGPWGMGITPGLGEGMEGVPRIWGRQGGVHGMAVTPGLGRAQRACRETGENPGVQADQPLPAGDAMSYHSGSVFSTRDHDPNRLIISCAVSYRGAWWYHNCHFANLNGMYGNNKDQQVPARAALQAHWAIQEPYGP